MSIESLLRSLAVEPSVGFVERLLAQVADHCAVLPSVAGPLLVVWNDDGVSLLLPATEDARADAEQRLGRAVVQVESAPPAVAGALASGTARTLRYDLRGSGEFQQAVLRTTAAIPAGEVRSYGWVARELGRPAAVRAVGTALGRNPVPVLIPCHRVVRADGRIGDYAFGAPMKRTLLAAEGVDVDELERLAAAGVRYVGSATTRVFCLPTCRDARRIRDGHRVTFRTERAAAAAGFRPCHHCRPAVAA